MRKTFAILLVGALALLATGCIHHRRHHRVKPAKVVVPVHAPLAAHLIIVHKRPAKHRHCSAHSGHWHCRR
ncbi:MAG: hypothetical protein GY723_06625 [bacterium]|nr:hypothetical protein [bacterium]MCP5065696.1 hypothetical protein [bacterium]